MINELCILSSSSLYPQLSGGGIRVLNLAKLGKDLFSRVSILSVDEKNTYERSLDGIHLVQAKKYNAPLEKIQYYFDAVFSANFSLKTPDLRLYNNNQTLFQIEGPYFYNTLKNMGIKKFILNEHNVHWDFGEFPTFNIKDSVYNKLMFKRNRAIEISALKNAAHVLACSERDAHNLINEVPEVEDKLTVIPNCVNLEEYQKFQKEHTIVRNDPELRTVLFIGLLSYPPNRDAVDAICSQIAPNFGKNVQFVIIGKNPPNISKPANVQFLGYVADVKEYIQNSDICIAPLRYGSGTRFKILEYMAMGKPVVSTSKGAEGIDYTNYVDIIIEDNFTEFSGRIDDLLQNRAMREKLGKNAQQLIQQKYDWEIYRKPLHDAYEACF
jgi:glycosyltransferase involved in cell wall biosynthesis